MNTLASRERQQPTQFPTYKSIVSGLLLLLLFGIWTNALGGESAVIADVAEDGDWLELGGSASDGGISASVGHSTYPSLAISPDGTPVVAWEDDSSGSQEIYVRRWNGIAWVEMGSGSASGGGISDNIGASRVPSLAISPAGTPFVAWMDNWDGDEEIYVRRWTGAAWEEVGSGSASGGGISANAGYSGEPSLAISPDGIPIIAWSDNSNGAAEIYVRRWDGVAWAELGSGSASGGGISVHARGSLCASLAISPDGMPVVAWLQSMSWSDWDIYVRRWNGSVWEEMSGSASDGGISNSGDLSGCPSLTIDPDGLPIIAWEYFSPPDKSEIYVRRWDGIDWVEMGSGSATGGGVSSNGSNGHRSFSPSAAISGEGSPVIAWEDVSADYGTQIYVRRWNGSVWVELGAHSASEGGISNRRYFQSLYPSLTIDRDGLPLVAWTEFPEKIYLRIWQPRYAVYFPAQEMAPGLGWRAGIQAQNKGLISANMLFAGYEADGKAVECDPQSAVPGSSVTFLTDYSCPSGHEPFSAAVIRSDQPADAIANIYNRGVGLAGGQYRGTANGDTTKELFFPLVKNDHNGRTTGFFVQNADDGVNDIVATFSVKGRRYTKEYKNIPPYSSIFILPEDAAVPSGLGQVGSLTVIATGPIAGASLEFDDGVSIANNLQTAKGFAPSEAGDILYCPLFRNAHANMLQTTGVQVQNASEAAQEITFTYVPVGDGQTITISEDVQPGASATFYAPELGIPKGSLGAVTITGETDIVAVVNDQGYAKGRRNMTTYSCFPANQASKEVFIPLYKEMYRGNTSGIQVQNVSGDGSSAKVTLTYRSNVAVSFTHENPIPDGGSITFWGVSTLASPSDIKLLSGTPSLLAKTVGSVEITADQPIVAIANETSYGSDASGQDAKNYEGFNN